jgi:hypothetical protein
MPTSDLFDDDRQALTEALRRWRLAGEANPLIPIDADLDGDGVADAWGLDSFSNLVLVPGVALADTVSSMHQGEDA